MRQTKQRWLLWLISFTVLALILAGCGNKEESGQGQQEDQVGQGIEEDLGVPEALDTSSDEVIATYDGLTTGEVTEGEFNRMLNIFSVLQPQTAMLIGQPEFKDQLLIQYIAQKSISPDIEQTEELQNNANEFVDGFKEQINQVQPEGKDFEAFIKDKGFSEEDLRHFILDSIKVDQHFMGDITEDDLQESYETLKEDKDLLLYNAKVSHILIQINEDRDMDEAEKRAKEVKKKLDEGGDFAELAAEYSDDGSKDNGGSLGDEPQPLTSYVPSFAEAARDLEIDEISDPVQSEFGYHIIKVEERQVLSFEEAKEFMRQDAVDKKYQHYVDNELEIDTKNS